MSSSGTDEIYSTVENRILKKTEIRVYELLKLALC